MKKTYELFEEFKIEEAQIHFQRGMEILNEPVDWEICEEIDKYMELPYTIQVEKEGNLYTASVKEIPDLEEQATSRKAALEHLDLMLRHHLKYAIEHDEDIPTP